MGFLREIIGLALVVVAWFNPFGLNSLIRIALFILGFDMISIIPKVGIFLIHFFYPIFGEAFGYFSWTLLFLFLSEIILMILRLGLPYNLIIKPIAVFVTAFLSAGLQVAIIVVVIDLLLNLTHKFKI